MDIRVYKTFIEVADNKHFGRAAENLYITTAAVSARIKQLEEFYKAQLFIRDKNNVRLSVAGEALYEYAKLIVEQIELSKDTVAKSHDGKPVFSIAATPNVWDTYLFNHIHPLSQSMDKVIVSAEISTLDTIHKKLNDRILDAGLLADPIKDDDFVNLEISSFDLCLVSNPNIPSEQYIFVDWGFGFFKEHAKYHKVTPALKTSTAMIAQELLLQSGGKAYLPHQAIEHLIESGDLIVEKTPINITRPIYLAYKKNTSRNHLIEQMLKVLTRSNS